MRTFKQFREANLNEAYKPSSGEKIIKQFKVGKDKFEAVISKKGSKFISYIDGDMLDQFNTAKEAESAINDFVKLIGK